MNQKEKLIWNSNFQTHHATDSMNNFYQIFVNFKNRHCLYINGNLIKEEWSSEPLFNIAEQMCGRKTDSK